MNRRLAILTVMLLAGCAQSSFSGRGGGGADAKPETQAAAKPAKTKSPANDVDAQATRRPSDGDDDDADLGQAVQSGVETDDGNAQRIDAVFSVMRGDDTASNTNCLKIVVDDGEPVNLGCNHGTAVPQVSIKARPKPHCNIVRLIFSTTDWKSGATGVRLDTATQAALVPSICQITPGPSTLAFRCEDGHDSDFNDLSLTIVGNADVALQVQGGPSTCQ